MSIDKNIEILDMDFDMAEKSKTINNKITLDTNLTQTTAVFSNTEVENVDLEELGNIEVSIPNNDGPYNPLNNYCGLFGGNQGSLASNVEKFIDDEKIRQIVARYYPEFDSEDLELLFYRMNYVGCGYIAGINTIFQEYLFHDELDFYDRFGFLPYNLGAVEAGEEMVNKVYNYDYLFLDFFLYYAKNERGFNTIEEVYGNVEEEIEFNNNIIEDGALSDEEFPRIGMKGTPLKTLGEVMQRYLAEKGIELSTSKIKIELEPGSEEWQKKKEELEELGVEIDSDTKLYETNLNADTAREILNQRKQIIIAAKDFTMYYPEDKDKNGKLDDIRADDVGPHAMSVVGTASDGKIVVSTWGEEVLVDPKEIGDYIIYEYGKFTPKDIY